MGVFTVAKGLLCNEIDMLLGSDYQFERSRKNQIAYFKSVT